MTEEHGKEKTKALSRYMGGGIVMTKSIATEIVETLWRDAPDIEKTECILLCQTYQLNPLMRHIYLVGYRCRDRAGEYITDRQGNYVLDWSIMIGIGATRLMAQRKHNYSYLDMTPRKATQEEIDKILGDTADPDSIYGFVHIKDIDTQAEAFGLRGIRKKEKIKGEEKGNTHLNLACIRAERLALDRQYPGEMPQGVEVVDERYMSEGEGKEPIISLQGEEKIGGAAEEQQAGEGKPGTAIISSTKQEINQTKIEVPAAELEGEGFHIDMGWLTQTLKEINWSQDTAKSWFSKFNIDTRGSLEEVIKRANREQIEQFVQEIQNKQAEKQRELF